MKQVSVSSKVLASQAAGKPYSLNLTRTGTVYNLDANLDYNRIQVHTAKGNMTMAELVKKSGKEVKGKAVIGMTSDIRAMRIALTRVGGGGRGLGYDCGDLACICSGEDDCIDLFDTTKCGPIAVCYPDSGICICIRI